MAARDLAVFVTPHGFGHAARAAAVLEALAARRPDVRFRLFTRVPEWFFAETVPRIDYRDCACDLGLIQDSAMDENLPRTLAGLADLLPPSSAWLDELAREVDGCGAVLCDIAPLGLAVARRAGIPGILQENFTWSWIYAAYRDEHPEIQPYIDAFADLEAQATHRIQTAPVCDPVPAPNLLAAPVSRPPRRLPAAVRADLGLAAGEKLVMVSMGGSDFDYARLLELRPPPGVRLLGAGAGDREERCGPWLLLPKNSRFYHPDLVNAADAVIAKAGYSTLAEVYNAGTPFGWILRDRFRETGPFDAFLTANANGRRVHPATDLNAAGFPAVLAELLARNRRPPDTPNGAARVAVFVAGLM